MTIIAALRVSTDQQDGDSQREQLRAWEQRTGRAIDKWAEDHASGAIPWQKRALAKVLEGAANGDTIIVSEISRIARSTVGVLSFLEAAAEQGVHVIAVAQNILLDDSMMGKAIATIFGMVAEIERAQLRERTKAALAAKRAAGQKLGRPRGSKSASMLDAKRPEIERLIAAKIGKRAICRLVGCSPGTLYAWIDEQNAKGADMQTIPLPL